MHIGLKINSKETKYMRLLNIFFLQVSDTYSSTFEFDFLDPR